ERNRSIGIAEAAGVRMVSDIRRSISRNGSKRFMLPPSVRSREVRRHRSALGPGGECCTVRVLPDGLALLLLECQTPAGCASLPARRCGVGDTPEVVPEGGRETSSVELFSTGCAWSLRWSARVSGLCRTVVHRPCPQLCAAGSRVVHRRSTFPPQAVHRGVLGEVRVRRTVARCGSVGGSW